MALTLFVDPPGFPVITAVLTGQASHPGVILKQKNECGAFFTLSHSFSLLLLTHQGSNLDSAEPKSDVLPITPWVSNNGAKLQKKTIYGRNVEAVRRIITDSFRLPNYKSHHSLTQLPRL